jgi:hypothetical protein
MSMSGDPCVCLAHRFECRDPDYTSTSTPPAAIRPLNSNVSWA